MFYIPWLHIHIYTHLFNLSCHHEMSPHDKRPPPSFFILIYHFTFDGKSHLYLHTNVFKYYLLKKYWNLFDFTLVLISFWFFFYYYITKFLFLHAFFIVHHQSKHFSLLFLIYNLSPYFCMRNYGRLFIHCLCLDGITQIFAYIFASLPSICFSSYWQLLTGR